MILNIELNGYRFFNNSNISFVADARIKRLLSNSMEIEGKNVLKTIGIYGSNNSGKTNIVVLLSIIKKVLEGKDDVIFNNNVFNDKEETSISIIYNNQDDLGWLKYEFIYNNYKSQYVFEKLSGISFYSSGNIMYKTIFEKNIKTNTFMVFENDNSHFLSIIPSRLPLLYSIELNSSSFNNLIIYYESLKKVANSIQVIKMYDIPFENTLETMKNKNNKKIDFINEFVKNADVLINRFEYDENINYQDSFEITYESNEQALSRLSKISDCYKLITTYGQTKVPSFIYDSTGTKKIESIASYIYDALVEGNILVIDELDNGLHFKLTRSIISVFNNLLNEKAQLLFITHDLLLIDCNKLMRKDQIYFIDRKQNDASLFCLKEATVNDGGPREVSDIIKHYNRGEFVDVPNPDFIDLIAEVLVHESK